MRCTAKKTFRGCRSRQRRPDRPGQGQPADPAPEDPGGFGHHGAARVRPQPRQGPQPRRTPHRHLFEPADTLADTGWHPHVAAIIRVERLVYTRSAKTGLLRHSSETAFYVANTPVAAVRAAEAIRAHWNVENTSHYSRDVTLGEDRSRIRTNPGVFARLRSFAFNILKANQTDTLSQDRYRAGLAGVGKLLRMLAVL